MTAASGVEEAATTDGEHMYEDVYNMNHRQVKAVKHSDGIHTYYNEIVPVGKPNNANKREKQNENVKNGASKKHKQQLAKEKKLKERKGKKSQTGKTASKDDDTNPYYNVFARCDTNEVGHVGNGNNGDKQTPGKSVNISKVATKPDETHSDDDISYTDEPCNIDDLYSKPHKAKKKDRVSTSQKSDDKAESSTTNTLTPPQAACSEKQHEVGNEKGSKLKVTTVGEADNTSGVRGDSEKTKVRRQESEERDAASAQEQSRTADKDNGKTDNKVKVTKFSEEPAAKSRDAPRRNKIGTPSNGEVPPCKPAVQPKPSVIPPPLPINLPATPKVKKDEYAYVKAPKDMKIVIDSAQSDIIVHAEDEGNEDADRDNTDTSDGDVSYTTLDHREGDNEEYDVEDQEYYDDHDEVAYAAIRKPDKPTTPNTTSVCATAGDVTVYVDNDLYSS